MFFTSKDGTKVPMFIARKKSTLATLNEKPEKPIPTLMYAYGGFSTISLPDFQIEKLLFMNNLAGMWVLVNIRGGGEYGEKWHQDGILDKK